MYAASRGHRPVSLGASLLISAGIVTALIFVSPNVVPQKYKTITGILVPPEVIPPPEPQPEIKPETKVPVESRIVTPEPLVRAPDVVPTIPTTPDINQPPPTPLAGKPEGTALTVPVKEPAPPLPPLIAAQTDPRYARDFQPNYPAAELRLGNEAVFKVRVRIGIDGRVREVQQVGSAPSAFWEATRKHALAKWRFKPATRGGIPEESWKTMSVRFELNE